MIVEILRQYWNYDSFRPMQEEIIHSVLEGRDTLALLPTGGGKSLCYQVPAMAKPGLCLVVSPLVALMKDQVDQLRKKGITAYSLNAGMSRKDVINTLRVASHSNCKFLYVSPERLETAVFMEWLLSLPVNLIAVDEAHCVSQWGYDFRPPYLRIAALREALPDIPVLALTATATPEVLDDISEKLQLRKPAVFRLPFTRPNLSYSLFKEENIVGKIIEILQKVSGSGIVYCKTRRISREISDALVRAGISAAAYHAGLTREERSQRQDGWIKDQVRVMVCTNAFGMGIDKPGVRTVIHAGAPESLENYYQEAGRAGRDGKKAYAVLLCRGQESVTLESMPEARYPGLDKIRPVYQALMNYLQLPVGSGEGNYFDFELNRFVDMFGGEGSFDMQLALSAIKALEQEGMISFQQQVYLPGRVQFVTDKGGLYAFEQDHPEMESLIHALLRNYEGIFEGAVPVREKQLAWLTRKELKQVVEDLRRLAAFSIIDYTVLKDTPQLYFFRNRVPAEDLYIDPVRYRQRKEQYALRIQSMVRYLDLGSSCRSRYLARYFGDLDAKACGICDNCLRAGKMEA